MAPGRVTKTGWVRQVATTMGEGATTTTLIQSERLDMDAAAKRLLEAMRERGDAGVRSWLDVALNGWGDE